MVNTIKFSQFSPITLNGTNSLVGLSNGANAISDLPINWTTATRPGTLPPFTAPTNGFSGYNTSLSEWEFWNGTTSSWEPVGGGGAGTVTDVNTGTGLTGGPIFTSGTISFAPIAANSFWANTTGGSAVPTVTSLSNFLQASLNLSDVPNKATARSNLGLAIGTNVEAWSSVLDQIAGGTWAGSTSLTTLGTITTGVWNGSTITVSFGGTGNTTFTPYSVITAGTTATGAFQNVVGLGTAGQVLTSAGAGALPTWTSTTGGSVSPGLINELAYYAAAGDDVSGLPTGNNGVLITSAGGVPSISSTLPNAVQTNITELGTVTVGVWNGSLIPLAFGGTNANLTASNGGIFYSTASAGAILLGTATANQILMSGSSSAPAWSTAVYPASTTINQILYSSSANVISGITAAASGVLITSAGDVPSISSTLPATVQGNITTLGTITSGVWNGTTIAVANGGTGNTTFTAYAVITAGTTATGPFQNVVGVGTVGQVLTSNGAAALPTWQTSSGGGAVNPGTANDLAYYATTGSALSPLASANGGVLVTSNSGVPSILAGSGTTGTVLQATASGTPAWSTATYPSSTSINQILYSSSANVVAGIASAANGVLITSAGNVPSISTTLPSTVQGNITALGTITTGVWNGTTIAVANGGTGNTTFTAYSVICAGTTATGAFQDVSGVGILGQVLTSQGAGALPIWSNAAGTGTVSSSFANNLAYYALTGNTISGLTSANGGVLVTSNTGVPSILAGSGTTGTVLQATASGTPAWSTATYPATTTINQILYSSTGNVVAGLSTANNGVLITSGAGAPSISSTLPSAVQGNITALGTIATGVWNGTTIAVANGGTGNTAFTAYAVLCAGTTATGAFQNVVGLGSSGQILTSNGAAALPTWQAAVNTGTVNSGLINQLAYYAAAGTTLSGLTTGNSGVLVTSSTGVPSILAGGTQNQVLQASTSGTPFWSTTTYPDTLAINTLLYASGANAVTGLATVTTAVLTTSAGVPTWATELSLALGGTNANLTASNGGIFYSTASAGAILAGTATAGQLLTSGASTTPAWTTTTYPLTNAINTIMYASSANVLGSIAAVNNGVLITSASGVPSFLADGTTGQVLTATTGSPPTWANAGGGGLQSATVTLTQSQIQNMYTTPIQIIAAPGAGLVILTISTTMYYLYSTTPFSGAGGRTVQTQYGNAAAGAGPYPSNGNLSGTNLTASASYFTTFGINGSPGTGISNKGIYISNTVGTYTGGSSGSTLTVTIIYYTVTATY